MVKFSIDRGGTFTDIYAEYQGKVVTEKLLSEDPNNYEDAAIEGMRRVLKKISTNKIEWIRMGTTVATNALLERKGARTALLITKGFGDILDIGYQNRPHLFELNIIKPKPIYEEVVEIQERVVWDNGHLKIEQSLNSEHVRKQLMASKERGIESLAVVLLHAYKFTKHEEMIEQIAKEIGFKHISLSHQVIPSIKVVDRGDTTLVNAYLTPHIQQHIKNLDQNLNRLGIKAPLQFMQSSGGLIDSDKFIGSNSILSGPAGGVIGYSSIYEGEPLIGFDMGGTSTDVSRYAGEYHLSYENMIDNIRIKAPHLDIRTVASGGGSRLFYKNSSFVVGPESSGAHPGPVCYKKNGPLSITDANLVLGRIIPEFFPKIFGKNENEPLDRSLSIKEFEKLQEKINSDLHKKMDIYQIALGYINVANSNMSKLIKEMSMELGFDLKEHTLCCFGGAGGQHACGIAKELGIKKIFIHKYAGILSAHGIGMANIVKDAHSFVNIAYDSLTQKEIENIFKNLFINNIDFLGDYQELRQIKILTMSYKGTDTNIDVLESLDGDYKKKFEQIHLSKYGFLMQDREIVVNEAKLRLISITQKLNRFKIDSSSSTPIPITIEKTYFTEGLLDTKVYRLEDLFYQDTIKGPAIILDSTSTILVEPDAKAVITEFGDVVIYLEEEYAYHISNEFNPINVSIFGNIFMSIAQQMGKVLRNTAISTNIKERLDYSCAIFNSKGELIANAPHIPVHLGSIGSCIKHLLKKFGDDIKQGDVFITNSPSEGGSHLPDITIISPHIQNGKILFITANRAHHADIGGITPGSMPSFSSVLSDEGAIIESFKIVNQGIFEEQKITSLLKKANCRKIDENLSDIKAQIASNIQGDQLLIELIDKYSYETVVKQMDYLLQISTRAVDRFLSTYLKNSSSLEAEDYLDNGSCIKLSIYQDSKNKDFIFDFSSSDIQSYSNQNAPLSITLSAIVYSLRVLLEEELPLNEGFLQNIRVKHRENGLLNPSVNAPIVGGNVTTSQRIVDVILKIFGRCADSSGCMNNFSFGNEKFGYYETIAGGAGAGDGFDGASAVHTHMTNTRITDPEILESRYPVILKEFSIRKGSGGKGKYNGGDGVVRKVKFLEEMHINLLTERRVFSPSGANGGKDAKRGRNTLIKDGIERNLGGKASVKVSRGDTVIIKTAGGGGFNKP